MTQLEGATRVALRPSVRTNTRSIVPPLPAPGCRHACTSPPHARMPPLTSLWLRLYDVGVFIYIHFLLRAQCFFFFCVFARVSVLMMCRRRCRRIAQAVFRGMAEQQLASGEERHVRSPQSRAGASSRQIVTLTRHLVFFLLLLRTQH